MYVCMCISTPSPWMYFPTTNEFPTGWAGAEQSAAGDRCECPLACVAFFSLPSPLPLTFHFPLTFSDLNFFFFFLFSFFLGAVKRG